MWLQSSAEAARNFMQEPRKPEASQAVFYHAGKHHATSQADWATTQQIFYLERMNWKLRASDA